MLGSAAGAKLSGCLGSQSGADTKGRLSNAAIQDHGRGSLGNQDLWVLLGRSGGKTSTVSTNRLGCRENTWKCATDEKSGEPCLPEKTGKQTYPWMFSFTVIFLSRHTREQQFQNSTEDPCKGKAIFFPSVITVWLRLPTELWPCAPPYLYQMAFPDRAGPSRTSAFVWVNQNLSGDFNLYRPLIWPIMSLFMGAFMVKISSHE